MCGECERSFWFSSERGGGGGELKDGIREQRRLQMGFAIAVVVRCVAVHVVLYGCARENALLVLTRIWCGHVVRHCCVSRSRRFYWPIEIFGGSMSVTCVAVLPHAATRAAIALYTAEKKRRADERISTGGHVRAGEPTRTHWRGLRVK